MIPKKVFFTKGVGRHLEMLHSFEIALRDAGIEKFNIVCVSSILPPGCKIISREKGLAQLKPGQIVFAVLARNATNEPNRLLASSIGAAIPADCNAYGYLSEHHSFGETEEKAGDYAEDLAATMLASTLGLEIDTNKSYDELKEEWKIQDKMVRTSSITKSAIADKNGLWTTTIAAAVLICDDDDDGDNGDIKQVNEIKADVKEIPNNQNNSQCVQKQNFASVSKQTVQNGNTKTITPKTNASPQKNNSGNNKKNSKSTESQSKINTILNKNESK